MYINSRNCNFYSFMTFQTMGRTQKNKLTCNLRLSIVLFLLHSCNSFGRYSLEIIYSAQNPYDPLRNHNFHTIYAYQCCKRISTNIDACIYVLIYDNMSPNENEVFLCSSVKIMTSVGNFSHCQNLEGLR
jgi:hypothetical protein